MHDMTGPLPKAMLPARRQAPYFAPPLPQLVREVERGGLRVLTWRDTTPAVLEYFLGIRRLLEEASGPATDGRPTNRPSGSDVLEAYVEILANFDGRTGIMVARRRTTEPAASRVSR